jgi:hypothetical protein
VIKVIFKPSIEIHELVSRSFEKPKLEQISCKNNDGVNIQKKFI